jgi:DNA-binding NarL/FixJ family response regulator
MSGNRTAVVVDAHPLWLDALMRLLGQAGITVAEVATTPAAALAAIREHEPALVVIDPDVADEALDGKSLTQRVLAEFPTTRVVAVGDSDDASTIAAAFAAGVTAYVVKRAPAQDVLAAVRQAFRPTIFLRSEAGMAEVHVPSRQLQEAELTKREREILRLVASGRTNGEVARTLWVTEQTVKFHLCNIYRKLGVSNRTAAGNWAHRNGLITADVESQADEPRLAVAAGSVR